MKRKEITLLIVIGFFTAVIAFVLSTVIFKVPASRSTKVPVAGSIDNNFPDIKHDSSYNTIFNDKALDPTVPLNANSNTNNQPFLGSSQ